jgi:hypothetical protein
MDAVETVRDDSKCWDACKSRRAYNSREANTQQGRNYINTTRMQAAAGASVIARTPANPRKINRKMVLEIREKGLIA